VRFVRHFIIYPAGLYRERVRSTNELDIGWGTTARWAGYVQSDTEDNKPG
jgi:hypothetical protein